MCEPRPIDRGPAEPKRRTVPWGAGPRRRESLAVFVVLVGLCSAALLAGGQDASPARYVAGGLPALPALALGGGQVFLDVTVDCDGGVAAIAPLRTTAPFTTAVVDAVRGWRFHPATESEAGGARRPVGSSVLVAALFRPPAFFGPTHGEPHRDVGLAVERTPTPLTSVVPSFPPNARDGGVVLLEVRIDRRGTVAVATILRSAPPYDAAALEAINGWRFRPARRDGRPVDSIALVLFGFAVPVAVVPQPSGADRP